MASDQQHEMSISLQFLSHLAAEHAKTEDFLRSAVMEAGHKLRLDSVAVARLTTANWRVLAAFDVDPSQFPRELASDAVDRDQVETLGDWMAAPLKVSADFVIDGSYALACRPALPDNTMDLFCQALGDALGQVVARERAARRIRRLERILEITQAWNQTGEMEELLTRLAEAATELLEADRASIFLWDRPRHTLVGRPALGIEGGELRIPDDRGIVGQVVQNAEPRRVHSDSVEDEISRDVDAQTGYHTETVLCVPLVTAQGNTLGAFEVLNKRYGNFTDEDERGLVEIATYAAAVLENTQQFSELLTKHQQLVEQAAGEVHLIGRSPAIEALRSTIKRVADTDLAVLILGENGTGKEVVARSIHYLSSRREQPFVAVNCAALAETLLESELFGHEKGAFTDAHEARSGKFELATGGTLLLDEIGDMSLSGQAKLLRVLEEKTVVRVGGSQPIHTEVRVVAATNQDLAAMVQKKKFREDLYYRLNVVSLDLPPLRERGDDILLLAEHFLESFCRQAGRRVPKFTASARKRMRGHRWPGNVRELRNLMERLAYLSPDESIDAGDLAFILSPTSDPTSLMDADLALNEATKQFQRQFIRRTIERVRGNVSEAANRLGVHRSNLYRKMRQLGMVSEHEEEEL